MKFLEAVAYLMENRVNKIGSGGLNISLSKKETHPLLFTFAYGSLAHRDAFTQYICAEDIDADWEPTDGPITGDKIDWKKNDLLATIQELFDDETLKASFKRPDGKVISLFVLELDHEPVLVYKEEGRSLIRAYMVTKSDYEGATKL